MKSFSALLVAVALAGCSLFHSPPARAATVIVTWVNPTTNVDDTPIAASGAESLQRWRIEYGTCTAGNTFGVKAGEFVRTRVASGPELTSATQNLPGGLTCVRVLVANSVGNESTASNVASRDVPAATPRAPTNTVITLQGS